MSKIKELLRADDSVLVFDIDGVLALSEFGEYNHFGLYDRDWFEACEKGINAYDETCVIKKMQDFLKTKDMSRIYVISKVGHINEEKFKKEYCMKYYNIPEENVYLVYHEDKKAGIMEQICNKYPELDRKRIAMIEDTVRTLTDIMEKVNCATIHISSFLDL